MNCPGCSLGKFTLRNATPSISIFLKVITERAEVYMRRHNEQEFVSWRKTNSWLAHGFPVRGGVTLTLRRQGINLWDTVRSVGKFFLF